MTSRHCRLVLTFSVAVQLVATNVWAKDDPTFLGDPGTNVKQARAHIGEQVATRLRWELATTLDPYNRIGNKDPRWDDTAREALTQNAHLLVGEHGEDGQRDATKALFDKTLSAGCTDPLVRYFGLRLGCYPPKTTPAELAKAYAEVETSLQAGDYPAIRKCYASVRAAEQALKAAKVHDAPKELNASIPVLLSRAETEFEKVLRDDSANRASVYDLEEAVFLPFAKRAPGGLAVVQDRLVKFFESNKGKILGDDPGAGLLEAAFWIDYAWAARSSKWAAQVTDEGWKLFGERLRKAETILDKVLARDQTDPRGPMSMMTVELGQGEGRERLEMWFRRSMNANPDSYDACKRKMLYLEPKWYGSEAEVLAFGRECLATKNWKSRIPFTLLAAHEDLADYSDKPSQYWIRPEVWADVQKLYSECLAANPDSVFDRSGYACHAYRAQQWKIASDLFTALAGKPDLRPMNCSMEEYHQMERNAAARAGKP